MLSQDSIEEKKTEPIIGVVDDLIEKGQFDVNTMMEEHLQEPKHFGIRVSQLETLVPESVKGDRTDKSIISHMFD